MKHLYLVLFFACFSSLAMAQNNSLAMANGRAQASSGEIQDFKLFPNPVTDGRITIETRNNAPKNILIFDVFGTQVMQQKLVGRELNLSRLDKGVYILRVFENNKSATRKLIIR
jgi:hypothetical protein